MLSKDITKGGKKVSIGGVLVAMSTLLIECFGLDTQTY